MDLPPQMREPVYATAGIGEWIWDALRDGVDRAEQAWRNRDQWSERAGHAYDDLVHRGEGLLTRAGREARQQTRRARETARRAPGAAAIEGEIVGLASAAEDLPITDYDRLTAAQITSRLASVSQRELHQIEGYELRHQSRATVLRRIQELRGNEPWPGYDEMNVDEIQPRLRELSADERGTVAAYEQRHKHRRTVIDTARIASE